MISTSMVENKIAAIQRDLSELMRFKDLSLDLVASSYDTHKVIERVIEVVINEAIDINQHLIVESGLGQLGFNFRESFLLLAKIGVYSQDFADRIAPSVGLRNILVHQYRDLDETLFYQAMQDCLRDYTEYCRHIMKFIRK
ncbi:MAG: DUF86 domain-containing protein [bacterium]